MANHVPWNAVINLSNSIIGVSILAMPWCFRECGVGLGIVLLLCGGFLTKYTCYLLLRASKVSRRHNYEFLAQHALGAPGKMLVELCIIGLLMCTCIAFFVIIGDLAPSIVARWFGLKNTWHLRCGILILVAVFIILPLGMKRSVESLGSLSMMSICFYLLFVANIFWNSLPTLLSMRWLDTMELWRLPGVLKGISIFSMSLCCQTTLFVVYDSLQEKTVKQMEQVVSKSVNMVSGIYILVGFFGYVCYINDGIKGDVLLNFAPSLLSEVLRLGFTVSVALSFPLCIFPCRASIYTLFCHSGISVENPHGGGDFIPPGKFNLITLMIVSATLVVGITVPNVEVILGWTGAILGSLIGFTIPAIIYILTKGVPNKNNAKIILMIGLLLLVCSTYDNLRTRTHEVPELPNKDMEKQPDIVPVIPDIKPDQPNVDVKEKGGDDVIKEGEKVPPKDAGQNVEEAKNGKPPNGEVQEKPPEKRAEIAEGQRQEPPNPQAPDSKEDNREGKKPVDAVILDKDKNKDSKEGKPLGVDETKKDLEKEDAEKAEAAKKEMDALQEENEEKQKLLQAKEKELHKKEEKLDQIVEHKFAERDQKQEEQEKKLEKLEVRQKEQEKIIEKQAEVIQKLKVKHDQDVDPFALVGDDQNADQMGVPMGGNLPQGGIQQQQQIPVNNPAMQPVGQQGGVQPVMPPDGMGAPVVQQGLAGQPVGQQGGAQPVMPQEGMGAPVAQQGLAGQPVGQQGVGQPVPVVQQGLAGQPMVQQGGAQPVFPQQVVPEQPIVQQPVAVQPQPVNLQGVVDVPQGGLAPQVGVAQQPGGVPQVGMAQQPGGAPQVGVAPQAGMAQKADPQIPQHGDHIVRREAPNNPQLQQQDIVQQQQQQQVIQLQQQLQQQGLNLPQQQLLPHINMPGEQVNNQAAAVMMQGAVAQQRQLLQGDSQATLQQDEQENGAGMPQDTKQDTQAGKQKEEVLKTEDKKNPVAADKRSQDSPKEQDQPMEKEVKPVPDEEHTGAKKEELAKKLLENKSQHTHEVKRELNELAEKQTNKTQPKVPDESKKSKASDAEEKTKETIDDTVGKGDTKVENDNLQEGKIEEANPHEVKFKTRQEMSVKTTNRRASSEEMIFNRTASNRQTEFNKQTPDNRGQTTEAEIKVLQQINTAKNKNNLKHSSASFADNLKKKKINRQH